MSVGLSVDRYVFMLIFFYIDIFQSSRLCVHTCTRVRVHFCVSLLEMHFALQLHPRVRVEACWTLMLLVL